MAPDMARTNRGSEASPRKATSRRFRGVPVPVAGSVLALLTLTLLVSPRRAAYPADLPTHVVQETDAGQSQTPDVEAVGFADRLVPDPGRSYKSGRWTWRVPKGEWWLGVLIGFSVAAWLLMGVVTSLRQQTLIEPASPRRGAYGRMIGSLATDPLVWVYLLAASAFAGAAYSGSFGWLSRGATELTGVATWAPTGVLGILGLLFGGGATRRMSKWKVGAGDADALMVMLEKKSSSFLELVRVHVDDGVRKGIPRLASAHDVGLIQRAVWTLSEKAVDHGRLEPAQREKLMSGLLEIEPGQDGRSAFFSSLAAVELATRLIDVDELAACLEETEWRKTDDRRVSTAGPRGAERRTGRERRVRSIWRPHGGLEPELAG